MRVKWFVKRYYSNSWECSRRRFQFIFLTPTTLLTEISSFYFMIVRRYTNDATLACLSLNSFMVSPKWLLLYQILHFSPFAYKSEKIKTASTRHSIKERERQRCGVTWIHSCSKRVHKCWVETFCRLQNFP